jgi:hypothetical protein
MSASVNWSLQGIVVLSSQMLFSYSTRMFESMACNHESAGCMYTLMTCHYRNSDMIYYAFISSAADLLLKSVDLCESAAELRCAKHSV